MDRWVRIFMTIWLGFIIIGGAAALIATVSHPIHGDAWIGVMCLWASCSSEFSFQSSGVGSERARRLS